MGEKAGRNIIRKMEFSNIWFNISHETNNIYLLRVPAPERKEA